MIFGNNNMLATGIEVLEYLPQRAPFVMIDKLVHSDDVKTISAFTILSTNILCVNGYLSESGLLENIAQTAGAGVGYICKQKKVIVPIGYIAAIKDLKVFRLPPVDAEIITEVTVTNQVLNITVVESTVQYNGEIIATCEMRIFIKQESSN